MERFRECHSDLFKEDLECCCAIAATKLYEHLDKNNYKDVVIALSETYHGSHAYVIVDYCKFVADGDNIPYIVDVTATQFGPCFNEVEVIPFMEAFQTGWWWRHTNLFMDSKSFIQYLNDIEWQDYQIPGVL